MKKHPSKNTSYRHADQVSWRRVGNETVLLDLDTSDYFSMNELGALIWERLGEGVDITKIVDEVCRTYAVDAQLATNDVEALIEQLLKRKLLTSPKS